mmetsp:Transcript_4888/g.10790  ORF Transcript_4888/g.10790 Transcript_4888/m.10790 type:complete len:98 (-) Transcript_4888:388-681(-)
MSSFISQLLQPGGGIALIPFIRATVCLLLLMTIVIFICGIARVHMVVLASLSTGLLISISWFERAWNDVQRRRGGQAKSGNDAAFLAQGNKEPEKTD